MTQLSRRALLCSAVAVGALRLTPAAWATPANPRRVTRTMQRAASRFVVGTDATGITSLSVRDDPYPTDYVYPGVALGTVRIAWRRNAGDWERFDSARAIAVRTTETDAGRIARYAIADALELQLEQALEGADLVWRITLHNASAAPVEIGDLMLPLPMNNIAGAAKDDGNAVLKHSFVSGHGSHLFWMRRNSVGPYLLLMPERDTQLEYWDMAAAETHDDGYCVYIHAAAAAAESAAKGTRWRIPVSNLLLAPGERRSYALRFSLVADYAAARDAIAAAGGIDVEVVPGMTVPSDLFVTLALRSSDTIHAIDAEHPAATRIEPLGERAGRQLYRIRFARLGENRLTIRHGDARATHLEFFATEPIETLIAKRGAFIAAHQHRDPTKWYHGLLGEWNMQSQTLLGPDAYDRIKGWRIYEVTCDDPGLSKPAFLAAKNAEHPVQAEVTALDDYVEHFVWGGLQRSTAETYPYAIYGIPDWKRNRDSVDPGTKGRLHIWRVYDYPHIILLYLSLYRIATDHPGVATRLDANAYLDRAVGTARAMFTIPKALANWSAYETGFYNECVLPELIVALDAAGRSAQAQELRGFWETKVRFFVTGRPDLFGSEYAFDSTGFESTQAIARYALDHPMPGLSRDTIESFSARQMAANLFCRGWLEPAYYLLGSDYRASGGNGYTLSYMAQMGGWAVLDHALGDTADPHPLLRLGYASFLSSWALLNSGTADSDYGYWYPGEANDGAAAGGFEPAPTGLTWLDQPHHRGAWYYACEIDLGFCGALRGAATILADDPIFGRIAYGGTVREVDQAIAIVPRDGVRRRFRARWTGGTVDLTLHAGRFAAEREIRLSRDGNRIEFVVEHGAAPVTLDLGAGRWRVAVTGTIVAEAGGAIPLALHGPSPATVTLTRLA